MRYISLFTGVGGFDLGFDRAGHQCILQVEQDKHCLDVLRRRWPNVPKMEDVRDVNRESAPDVDMVIGGFPCQDVSLAGGRRGLDGGQSRSGLWFEFHRIISELQPRVAVIENVPGLFSSNRGRDFATILRGLAEQRYMSAWRVLDAQYFGVPQRRRRVFVVASLGDGSSAEILFERESLRRDTTQSRKTRPGAAEEPQGRPGGGDTEYNAYSASERISGTNGTASTLNSGGGGTGAKTGLYCIQENVIGRSDEHGPAGKGYKKDQAFTLNATAPHAVAGPTHIPEVAEPIPISTLAATRPESSDQNNQGFGIGEPGDPMYTIQAGHHHAVAAIPIDMQNAANLSDRLTDPKREGGGIGKDGDPMYTLNSNDRHAVSATVTAKQAGGPAGSASETDNYLIQDTVGTLAPGAHPGGWNGQDAYTGNLIPQGAVRRLTPVECCRLQGFPDDWNDDQTDSQRYRQMGNAVCVPVAEWIGRRIAETMT